MLRHVVHDEQRGELIYWLWKLSGNQEEYRSQALELYQQLMTKTMKQVYANSIEELSASSSSSASA